MSGAGLFRGSFVCPRCGCATAHNVDVEFVRPEGRWCEYQIGDLVPLVWRPATIDSYVITPSLAFGMAICQRCYFMSYALLELREGRLFSVRHWGLELPERVETIYEYDDDE